MISITETADPTFFFCVIVTVPAPVTLTNTGEGRFTAVDVAAVNVNVLPRLVSASVAALLPAAVKAPKIAGPAISSETLSSAVEARVSEVVNAIVELTPASALSASEDKTVTPRAPLASVEDSSYPPLTAAEACGIATKNVLDTAAAIIRAIFLNELIYFFSFFFLSLNEHRNLFCIYISPM